MGEYGPLQNLSYAPLADSELHKTIRDYVKSDGSWDLDDLKELLPSCILEAIVSIKVRPMGAKATCQWSLNKNGQFSVKSAYRISESLSWNDKDSSWITLWKLPMAQTIKTFGWLLLKGKLLTNAERQRKKMTISPGCEICGDDLEDLDHVFKHCPLAAELWTELLPDPYYRKLTSSSIISWLVFMLQQSDCHISWKIGVFITCWELWRARNQSIFKGQSHTVRTLLSHIRPIITSSLRSFSVISTFM